MRRSYTRLEAALRHYNDECYYDFQDFFLFKGSSGHLWMIISFIFSWNILLVVLWLVSFQSKSSFSFIVSQFLTLGPRLEISTRSTAVLF